MPSSCYVMPLRHALFIASAFLIFSGCALGLGTDENEETVDVDVEPSSCLQQYTFDGSRAFYDDLAIYDEMAYESITAQDPIDFDAFRPIPTLTEFAALGQPLLWINQEKTEVVVDGRYFSDLTVVDVTSFFGQQDPLTIGRVMPAVLEVFEPQEIVRFLLTSEIIRTYAHLEAEVCWVSENETPETYSAYFEGVHRYCTQECVEDSYVFRFEMDKVSGLITVVLD